MKFYDVDAALQEAIIKADSLIRLRLDILFSEQVISMTDDDIIEATFYGLKETAGGTSSRGEVIFINEKIKERKERSSGSEVRIFFSLGDGLPFFERFVFYIDEKGIQDIRGSGRKRFVHISLKDLSYTLRKTDEQMD
jgi:hypothetical protein